MTVVTVPELPEVETIRRGLEPYLAGRRLESVLMRRANLRYPLPDIDGGLRGNVCQGVRRRGKYLLFDFQSRLLVWHLGMSGQFHVLPHDADAGAHEHVQLDFTDDVSLRYRDPRRFGYAGLLSATGWQSHPWFCNLGSEPLEAGFDVEYLLKHSRGRKMPIKQLLMDARVVVGIGNIYACESLFRAGIHPRRAAGRIGKARMARLVDAVCNVLKEAIQAGGNSISDFVQVDGKPGYFAHAFQVYGRDHKRCVCCGHVIRRIVLSGRGTFYCPCCQH